MNYFYRTYFPLFAHEEHFPVQYACAHPKASVQGVGCLPVRRLDGSIEAWQGYLIIRDQGEPVNATRRKTVYVVNAQKDVGELPPDVGNMVGEFFSEHHQHSWLVFAQREEEASRRVADSPQKGSPASPARPRTSASAASSSSAGPDRTSPTPLAGETTSFPDSPEALWPL